jgi:type IV pilus assembly protein PilE
LLGESTVASIHKHLILKNNKNRPFNFFVPYGARKTTYLPFVGKYAPLISRRNDFAACPYYIVDKQKRIFAMNKTYRTKHGFTLIEMMITVAIIGILAAVAIPSYSNYVLRAKTTEATTALADMRVKLEQYYQDNRNYGPVASPCGVGVPLGAAAKSFSYACAWKTPADNQTFIVTATGRAAEGMSGYEYTIDEANAKKSKVPDTAEVNCWITKKGEAC